MVFLEISDTSAKTKMKHDFLLFLCLNECVSVPALCSPFPMFSFHVRPLSPHSAAKKSVKSLAGICSRV